MVILMSELKNDIVYHRIVNKFDEGIFTYGENCKLTKYYFNNLKIDDVPFHKRTPEVCASLMDYCRCKLRDVPKASRTRSFYISQFTDSDVFSYIKNHIDQFDRQFFKDLLTSNEYSMIFDKNAFLIMPLEYIDEEMCSLSILHSVDWSDGKWFSIVAKRKPEALTADLWKLGARLYAREQDGKCDYCYITPSEYKDEEYYKELCLSNFNCGNSLKTNKGKIMNFVPENFLTLDFLLSLLIEDFESACRFSEKALEMEFEYMDDGQRRKEKIWQFVIRRDGFLIRELVLNDERISFFLDYYGKDSPEYRIGLKDKYREYKKIRENPIAYQQKMKRIQDYYMRVCGGTLFSALAHQQRGKDPLNSIAIVSECTRNAGNDFLPIKYQGLVPRELAKEFDSEEFLELIYRNLGIQIMEEQDDLFYRVQLPNGWTTTRDGYFNSVKDSQNNTILTYFYDSKFYDREAYVSRLDILEKKEEKPQGKLLLKKNDKITEENN